MSLDEIIPKSNNAELNDAEKALYESDDIVTQELTSQKTKDDEMVTKQVVKQSRSHLKDLGNMPQTKKATADVNDELLNDMLTAPVIQKQQEEMKLAEEKIKYSAAKITKINAIQAEQPPVTKRPLFYKTTLTLITLIILIVTFVVLYGFVQQQTRQMQQQVQQQFNNPQPQATTVPIQQPQVQQLQQPWQQNPPGYTPIVTPEQQYPQQPQPVFKQALVGGKQRLRDAKGRFIKSK